MEPQSSPAPRTGLILVNDLMFASQIQGLARLAGVTLHWVRSAEKALAQAGAVRPVCVVLDVNLIGAGIGEFVASIKAQGEPQPVIIGFGSHVDAASLQRARDVGCNLVMARSKLVQELATKLAEWIGKD